MNCPSKTKNGRQRLMEFAMRRTPAMERVEYQVHADTCPVCQSFIAQQRQVFTALDSWQMVSPSPDFDARLFARIEREANDTWVQRIWRSIDRRFWIGSNALPLGIAALVVAGFVTSDPAQWITNLRGHFSPSAVPAAAPVTVQNPAALLEQAGADLQLLGLVDPVKRRSHRSHSRPM